MVITRQHLFVFFLGMLLCSLALSPFFLSVSMIALGVLAIFDVEWRGNRPHIDVNREGTRRLKQFWHYPEFLALCLLFMVVLWGFWDIRDPGYFLERIRIKIPFLLFPLAFIALPKLRRRDMSAIFSFLLLVISMLSLFVLINYMVNFNEIQAMLKEGKAIPTPRNHIRFSLLVAVSILGGFFLWQQNYFWMFRWERRLNKVLTVFLIIFIHILSVKTGLLALYAMFFVLILRDMVISASKVRATLLLFAFFILPILGYLTIPSFRQKISYTLFDLKMYHQGVGGNYADAGRLISMEAGISIAKAHWVTGTGAGNLKREMRKVMEEEYPGYKSTLMPHNQYITILAGAGVTGCLVFLFGLYYPLFHRKNYMHWPLLAFYTMLITIFLIEATLENAAGVGFSIFFLLLFLSVYSKAGDEDYA